MKKSGIFAAALILSLNMKAQSNIINDIMELYNGKPGVTLLDLSGNIFKMFASSQDSGQDKTNDLISNIKSLKIITVTQSLNTSHLSLVNDLNSRVKFNRYQELMVVKNSDADIKILAVESSKIISELLLIVDGKDKEVMVWMDGAVPLNKVTALASEMDIEELKPLEYVR